MSAELACLRCGRTDTVISYSRAFKLPVHYCRCGAWALTAFGSKLASEFRAQRERNGVVVGTPE